MNNPIPPPPPPEPRDVIQQTVAYPPRIRLTIVTGRNLAAGLFGLIVALLAFAYGMQTGTLGLDLFVLFPLLVGLSMGIIMHPRPASLFGVTAASYFLFNILSVFLLREGVICLIIATPIFLPFVWLGAWAGFGVQRLFRHMRSRLAVLALFALGSGLYSSYWISRHDLAADPEHVATTSMHINAPPDAVWRALKSDRRYTEPPPLLFQWGLPAPKEVAANDKPGVASTELTGLGTSEVATGSTWSITNPAGKITLKATRVIPRNELTFSFESVQFYRNPPRGRRPTDWVTMLDGSFVLKANPDGTTELTRSVRFRRHLFPGFYFGPVEVFAMDALNSYVLRTIATSAESSR